MEAVPRLPMLSFELKVSPENTEFGSKLKPYIREFYHEDGESYNKEIKELEALRAAAVRVPKDYTGCSTLKRYYSQLHLLQLRFPMTDEGAACVPFMWCDIYSGLVFNITDIKYEQACILYNIGALHSELGAMDSRQTSEGMKISCTHFQCAGWAFQYLRDNFPQPKGSDMSHDLLTFFINVMLAQAQECILEKSMLDNRKSTIIAKVAAQIVDYYKQAQKTLETGSKSMESGCIHDIIGSKLFKSWQKYLQFKMSYHTCIANLYMSNQSEEQRKMGERVGYLEASMEKLNEAIKISKGLEKDEIGEALTFTMDVVGGKYNAAKKENDFVYHEKVPPIDSLPEIKGASLVKGIPFHPTDPEVSGPDIFGRLVPMEAHEASSLYSEEKAKILRRISASVDEKDQELGTYMASLQMDQLKLGSEPERLPQELIECCAAMSVKPNVIQDLITAMQNLSSIYHDVESAIQEVQQLLKEEEEKEKEYQEMIGKRAPSMILLDIKKECSKYQEAHQKASESNSNLHRAMNLHIANLRLLCSPLEELQKAIPSLNLLDAPNDDGIQQELQRLLSKVQEMKNQRQMLESQLREQIQSDDITKQLVTHGGKNMQEVFQQELKKHERQVMLLEQNLAAQDNILQALTDANARYANTRKATNEILNKRETMINALIASYEAYEDLLAKSQKGLDFYSKLEASVNKLLQRSRSVCKVQDEERETMLGKSGKKVNAAVKPDVPISDTGPKLKDYLPFIQKQSGIPVVPGSMPSMPASISSSGNYPSRASTSPSSSVVITAASTVQPQADFTGSAVNAVAYLPRPAPVGSEQTDIAPPHCSANILHPNLATEHKDSSSLSYPVPFCQPSSFIHPTMGTVLTSVSATQGPLTSVVPPSLDTSLLPPNKGAVSTAGYIPMQPIQDYKYPVTSAALPTSTSGYIMPSNPASLIAGNYNFTIDSANQYGVPSQINSTGYAVLGQKDYQYPSNYLSQHTGPLPFPATTALNSTSNVLPNSSQTVSEIPYSGPTNTTTVTYPVPSGYYPTDIQGQYPQSYSNFRPQIPTANQAFTTTVYSQTTPIQTSTFSSTGKMSQFPSGNIYDTVPNAGSYQLAALQGYRNLQTQVSGASTDYSAASYSQQTYPYQYVQPQSPDVSNAPQSYVDNTVSSNSNQQPTPVSQTVCQASQYPYSTSYAYSIAQSLPSNTWTSTSTYSQLTNPAVAANDYSSGLNPQVNIPSSQCSGSVSDGASNLQYQYTNQVPYQTFGSTNFTQSQGYGYPSAVSPQITNPANINQITSTQIGSTPVANQVYMNQVSVIPSDPINLATSNQTVSPQIGVQIPSQIIPPSAAVINPNLPSLSSDGDASANTNLHLLQQLQMSSGDGTVDNSANSSGLQVSNQSQVNLHAGCDTSHYACQPLSAQQPQHNSLPVHNPAAALPSSPDLLSGSFDSSHQKSSSKLLQPKILSADDIKTQKEEKMREARRLIPKDPFSDPECLSKFVSEIERFEKIVEGLTKQSLKGVTPLDQKFKELQETQDRESRKLVISVARCYSMKNRLADIMPYDNNRVELTSEKDDYINASYLKNLSQASAEFVATQAPLPTTFADFWQMIFEQQTEIIVCLISNAELKNHSYWPKDKSQSLSYGVISLSFLNSKQKPWGVETMINVTHTQTRVSRVVIHLQCTIWPPSDNPSNMQHFLQLVTDTISYYQQQRNLSRPIVVHCGAGVGRSGAFCLIVAAIQDINGGHGIIDLHAVAMRMTLMRKYIIQEKEQLCFCYQAVLYYGQDVLMKRGILTSKASFDSKLDSKGNHVRHPSADFILGATDLNKLCSGLDLEPSHPNVNQVSDSASTTVSNGGEHEIEKETVSSASSVSGSDITDSPQHLAVGGSLGVLASLDPEKFSLDPLPTKGKRKIAKESFLNPVSGLADSQVDPSDPLSQLDPLWILHKKES